MHELSRDEIKFSAARYNRKGNLVLTAHHTTTQAQLNSVADDIKPFIERLSDTHGTPLSHPITARANVKWSKLLINSVPISINKTRGPFTSDECHRSLVAHNPSYAALKITQKPSWVCPPSSLTADTQSSLVVAFKDPDGSARRSILSNKQLFILDTRAKVTRWKEMKHSTRKSDTPTPETTLGLSPLKRSHTLSPSPATPPHSPSNMLQVCRYHACHINSIGLVD